MARLWNPLSRVHIQHVLVIWFLLCGRAVISQTTASSEDEMPHSLDTFIEVVLHSASILRDNTVEALGTILQHLEMEQHLAWDRVATIRRLHNSLISRETNILHLLSEAQRIRQSLPTITATEETVMFFNFITESLCMKFQWEKEVSLLKSYKIGSVLHGLPENLIKLEYTKLSQIVSLNTTAFFNIILNKIQNGHVILTTSLIVNLLKNIPFPCSIPDTHEVLHYVSEELLIRNELLENYLPSIRIKSQSNIRDFLFNVFHFLRSKESPLQPLIKFQIDKIIPHLSSTYCRDVKSQEIKISHQYHKLFRIIRDDEFPSDVIHARDILMSAILLGKLDIRKYSHGFTPTLYGNDLLAILFAFLSRLSVTLPNTHPASTYIHTLLGHVKMKYITSNGGTFVPSTAIDIGMLLNSFNTLNPDLSETNIEIYRAFQKSIQWKKILKNFPYRRYSQPRSLFTAMLNHLLHVDHEMKLCHKLVLKYFLEKVQNNINQCQNLHMPVSQNNMIPLSNENTKSVKFNIPVLFPPINIFNETLSSLEIKYLPHNQKWLSTINQEILTTENPTNNNQNNDAEKVIKPQRDRKVIPSKSSVTIQCPSTSSFESLDGNSKESRPTLFNQKCSSNYHTDKAIVAAINNILLHIENTRNGIFPNYTYIICTDTNDNKLKITVNDERCITESSNELYVSTTSMTISPIQRKDFTLCLNSANKIIWVNVTSLLKSVDAELTETELQLMKEILTPEVIHGFDVTRYNTKGKLLYELLSFVITNITLHQSTTNTIRYIMNNVQMDGPGAQRPVLTCVNLTTDDNVATTFTELTERTPSALNTSTCIDNITKEKGIKIIIPRIPPLLKAIAPNSPQHWQNIVSEYLRKPAVINQLRNFNFEQYRTRGQLLKYILLFLASNDSDLNSEMLKVIHLILPFIQMDGFGALSPEMDVLCNTSTEVPIIISQNRKTEAITSTNILTTESTAQLESVTEYVSSTKFTVSTDFFTLPQFIYSYVQRNKSKLRTTICTDQQTKTYIPNVLSLLEGNEKDSSQQAMEITKNFLQNIDISELIGKFDNETYNTKVELLSQILIFIKRDRNVQPDIATAFDEVLEKIKYDKNGIEKPEFIEVCINKNITTKAPLKYNQFKSSNDIDKSYMLHYTKTDTFQEKPFHTKLPDSGISSEEYTETIQYETDEMFTGISTPWPTAKLPFLFHIIHEYPSGSLVTTETTDAPIITSAITELTTHSTTWFTSTESLTLPPLFYINNTVYSKYTLPTMSREVTLEKAETNTQPPLLQDIHETKTTIPINLIGNTSETTETISKLTAIETTTQISMYPTEWQTKTTELTSETTPSLTLFSVTQTIPVYKRNETVSTTLTRHAETTGTLETWSTSETTTYLTTLETAAMELTSDTEEMSTLNDNVQNVTSEPISSQFTSEVLTNSTITWPILSTEKEESFSLPHLLHVVHKENTTDISDIPILTTETSDSSFPETEITTQSTLSWSIKTTELTSEKSKLLVLPSLQDVPVPVIYEKNVTNISNILTTQTTEVTITLTDISTTPEIETYSTTTWPIISTEITLEKPETFTLPSLLNVTYNNRANIPSEFTDSSQTTETLTTTSVIFTIMPQITTEWPNTTELMSEISQSLTLPSLLHVMYDRTEMSTSSAISDVTHTNEITMTQMETSTIPEITMTQMETSTIPEITMTQMETSTIPEITMTQMETSTIPEITMTQMETSTIPEITMTQMETSTVPEITMTQMKISTIPELTMTQMKTSTTPEITMTQMETSTIPEITMTKMKTSTIPEITMTQIETSTVPEITTYSTTLKIIPTELTSEESQSFTPLSLSHVTNISDIFTTQTSEVTNTPITISVTPEIITYTATSLPATPTELTSEKGKSLKLPTLLHKLYEKNKTTICNLNTQTTETISMPIEISVTPQITTHHVTTPSPISAEKTSESAEIFTLPSLLHVIYENNITNISTVPTDFAEITATENTVVAISSTHEINISDKVIDLIETYTTETASLTVPEITEYSTTLQTVQTELTSENIKSLTLPHLLHIMKEETLANIPSIQTDVTLTSKMNTTETALSTTPETTTNSKIIPQTLSTELQSLTTVMTELFSSLHGTQETDVTNAYDILSDTTQTAKIISSPTTFNATYEITMHFTTQSTLSTEFRQETYETITLPTLLFVVNETDVTNNSVTLTSTTQILETTSIPPAISTTSEKIMYYSTASQTHIIPTEEKLKTTKSLTLPYLLHMSYEQTKPTHYSDITTDVTQPYHTSLFPTTSTELISDITEAHTLPPLLNIITNVNMTSRPHTLHDTTQGTEKTSMLYFTSITPTVSTNPTKLGDELTKSTAHVNESFTLPQLLHIIYGSNETNISGTSSDIISMPFSNSLTPETSTYSSKITTESIKSIAGSTELFTLPHVPSNIRSTTSQITDTMSTLFSTSVTPKTTTYPSPITTESVMSTADVRESFTLPHLLYINYKSNTTNTSEMQRNATESTPLSIAIKPETSTFSTPETTVSVTSPGDISEPFTLPYLLHTIYESNITNTSSNILSDTKVITSTQFFTSVTPKIPTQSIQVSVEPTSTSDVRDSFTLPHLLHINYGRNIKNTSDILSHKRNETINILHSTSVTPETSTYSTLAITESIKSTANISKTFTLPQLLYMTYESNGRNTTDMSNSIIQRNDTRGTLYSTSATPETSTYSTPVTTEYITSTADLRESFTLPNLLHINYENNVTNTSNILTETTERNVRSTLFSIPVTPKTSTYFTQVTTESIMPTTEFRESFTLPHLPNLNYESNITNTSDILSDTTQRNIITSTPFSTSVTLKTSTYSTPINIKSVTSTIEKEFFTLPHLLHINYESNITNTSDISSDTTQRDVTINTPVFISLTPKIPTYSTPVTTESVTSMVDVKESLTLPQVLHINYESNINISDILSDTSTPFSTSVTPKTSTYFTSMDTKSVTSTVYEKDSFTLPHLLHINYESNVINTSDILNDTTSTSFSTSVTPKTLTYSTPMMIEPVTSTADVKESFTLPHLLHINYESNITGTPFTTSVTPKTSTHSTPVSTKSIKPTTDISKSFTLPHLLHIIYESNVTDTSDILHGTTEENEITSILFYNTVTPKTATYIMTTTESIKSTAEVGKFFTLPSFEHIIYQSNMTYISDILNDTIERNKTSSTSFSSSVAPETSTYSTIIIPESTNSTADIKESYTLPILQYVFYETNVTNTTYMLSEPVKRNETTVITPLETSTLPQILHMIYEINMMNISHVVNDSTSRIETTTSTHTQPKSISHPKTTTTPASINLTSVTKEYLTLPYLLDIMYETNATNISDILITTIKAETTSTKPERTAYDSTITPTTTEIASDISKSFTLPKLLHTLYEKKVSYFSDSTHEIQRTETVSAPLSTTTTPEIITHSTETVSAPPSTITTPEIITHSTETVSAPSSTITTPEIIRHSTETVSSPLSTITTPEIITHSTETVSAPPSTTTTPEIITHSTETVSAPLSTTTTPEIITHSTETVSAPLSTTTTPEIITHSTETVSAPLSTTTTPEIITHSTKTVSAPLSTTSTPEIITHSTETVSAPLSTITTPEIITHSTETISASPSTITTPEIITHSTETVSAPLSSITTPEIITHSTETISASPSTITTPEIITHSTETVSAPLSTTTTPEIITHSTETVSAPLSTTTTPAIITHSTTMSSITKFTSDRTQLFTHPYLLQTINDLDINNVSNTETNMDQESEMMSESSFIPELTIWPTMPTEFTSDINESLTLPTLLNVIYETNLTNTSTHCTRGQVPIFIPNMETLLLALEANVSEVSVNVIIDLFKTKDIVTLLKNFYTEEFKTRAELLVKILTYVKFTYPIQESSTLDAFNDILLHIQFEGEGAMKPDFIWTCQDIELPTFVYQLERPTVSTLHSTIEYLNEEGTISMADTTIMPTLQTIPAPFKPVHFFSLNNISELTVLPRKQIPIPIPCFDKNGKRTVISHNSDILFNLLNVTIITNYKIIIYNFLLQKHTYNILAGETNNTQHWKSEFNIYNFTTYGSLLEGILLFLRQRNDISKYILIAIDNVLPFIKLDKLSSFPFDANTFCSNTIVNMVNIDNLKKPNIILPVNFSSHFMLPITIPFEIKHTATQTPMQWYHELSDLKTETESVTPPTLPHTFYETNVTDITDNTQTSKTVTSLDLFTTLSSSTPHSTITWSSTSTEFPVVPTLLHIIYEINRKNISDLPILNYTTEMYEKTTTQFTPCNKFETTILSTSLTTVPTESTLETTKPTSLEMLHDITVTNTSLKCSKNQTTVFIPNISSLLHATDNEVPTESINSIIMLFNKQEILEILREFDYEKIKKRDEMLTALLKFLLMAFEGLEQRDHTAINDILSHIQFDGHEVMETDFVLVCQDSDSLKQDSESVKYTPRNITLGYISHTTVPGKVHEESKLNSMSTISEESSTLKSQLLTSFPLTTTVYEETESVTLQGSIINLQTSTVSIPEYVEETPNEGEKVQSELILPEKCSEGETEMLIIEMSSLFESVHPNISQIIKDKIIQTISTPDVQNELKILKWSDYQTRGEFLKDILLYLITNSNKVFHIKDDISKVLNHIQMDGIGASPPAFQFTCIPTTFSPTENFSLKEPIIKIFTRKNCSTNTTSNAIMLISIPSLIKAIHPTVPRKAKAMIIALFTGVNFSHLVTDFKAEEFKTNGQLLEALLDHLTTQPALEIKVLESIKIVLHFIIFDGFGALPPNITIFCNIIIRPATSNITADVEITQIKEIKTYFTTESEVFKTTETTIIKSDTSTTIPTSIIFSESRKSDLSSTSKLLPAITKECPIIIPSECSDVINDNNIVASMVVDVPTLLQAIQKDLLPEKMLKIIQNILETPEVQKHLLDIDFEQYMKREKILISLLNFAKFEVLEDETKIDVINKVIPHISPSGAGSLSPIFRFVCENISLTNTELGHCGLTSSGKVLSPVYALNLDNLFKTLRKSVPHRDKTIVRKHFSTLHFPADLKGFHPKASETQGTLFNRLLTFFTKKSIKDETISRAINNLIPFISFDGHGKDIAALEMMCNFTFCSHQIINKLPMPLEEIVDVTSVPSLTHVENIYEILSTSISITKPDQLQFVYATTEKETEINTEPIHKIVMNNKCFDNGTMKTLTVDVSSLVDIIECAGNTCLQLINILKTPYIQEKLKQFNWNAYHDTKGKLLIEILHFLLKSASNEQEHNILKTILPLVNMDGEESKPPSFSVSCIIRGEEEEGSNKSDQYDGPILEAIVMPSERKCKNNETQMILVNIYPLFEVLKPSTPSLAKSIFIAYVTQPQFHKKLSNFNLTNFQTRGEQLQKLLAYLETKVSMETVLMAAINNLKQNVRLDGPGKLPPPLEFVCNTTLNSLVGIPVTKEKATILPIISSIRRTYHASVLAPCIQSSPELTYQIDFPDIFYALEQNAPRRSLTKIVEFFTKPTFYKVLQNFDVAVHKTRGHLLAAIFTFLTNKLSNKDIVEAMQDIFPYIKYDGLGDKLPHVTPNCTLPDLKTTRSDITTDQLLPSQGPRLTDLNGNECMMVLPDTPQVQGTTTYKIDLLSLIQIINDSDSRRDTIVALFSSGYLDSKLHYLNLKNYTSREELLNGILSLLQHYSDLENTSLQPIMNIQLPVQYGNDGAMPPLISAQCTANSIEHTTNFLTYTTNDTCFMPSKYSKSGMPYKLQTETLLETIKLEPSTKAAQTVLSFFRETNIYLYLHGFNILEYKTQAELMRALLIYFALNPEIKLEYKKAMATVLPNVRTDGPGALSPVIITTCPEIPENKEQSTPLTYSYLALTEDISAETTTLDSCRSNTNSIIATQFDASLFEALDNSSSNISIAKILDFLNKEDTMETKLRFFDTDKYLTKGDLLQALLGFIWVHQDSQDDEREAARSLLPHVIFQGVGKEPPNLKTYCYIPKGSAESRSGDDKTHPLTLVYPTTNKCITNITHLPGIFVYRIDISSLFKALKPNIEQESYLPITTFLSKPYGYKYIQGINMGRYNTKGELLRAVLTFLRYGPSHLDPKVKQAIINILPSIQMDGPGKFPVERQVLCSPNLQEDNFKNIDLSELTQTITKHEFSTDVSEGFHRIIKYITSPQFNLPQHLPWLDYQQPITYGQLFRLILLQILDRNPTAGKDIVRLLPYVQENEGIGKKLLNIGPIKNANILVPYEIDFLQLLQVLKPEAPQKSIATIFKLFDKHEIYNNFKDFNPNIYETQGELLIGLLTFLKSKYNASTELGKNILQLFPYVDLNGTGSLPPVLKKLYITSSISANIFILDFNVLYKIIPRYNLTVEEFHALDRVFKYLSTEGINCLELFQGLSSGLSPKVQLNMLLNKLKEVSHDSLKNYSLILLHYLEKHLTQDSYQDTDPLPEMDWIEVLHAIPDAGVPAEVTASKKELYWFLLSDTFKNAVHNFRINLSLNRANFLKVLLAYVRNNPEVTKIQVIKNAIAYVYIFIKEEGPGLVSVEDDIILPEQEDEARNARNRIKELLYQVLGLVEQEGVFEILQILQNLFDSRKINLETTYVGYDVLEEFPPKERLIIILRRIYHNFIMFLDQDTVSAIDMVFISLGETKEETSQTLHYLPINIDELFKIVLGEDTPPLVTAAAEMLTNFVNLRTLPLGKPFQGIVPSILNLTPHARLSVVLRILWRIYSKLHNDKLLHAIKAIYEYIQPQKFGTEISTQEHHMAIIAALTSLIRKNAPSNVRKAKYIVINQLTLQKNVYDKALARLVTRNLSPKELIAYSLRRFRVHQYKMNPELWLSVSTIFEYLSIPEYDFSDDEATDSINIVDEFKYLVDEAGIEVAPAKAILMKFMIDRKQEISKIFQGHKVLLQYPPKEKMTFLLRRLLRIYGKNLEPKIKWALETILNHLNTTVIIEEEENVIDIFELLDTVIDQASPDNVITAKNLVKATLNENPFMISHILSGIIIQKDFNQHRRLAIILRCLYRKYRLEIGKEVTRALTTLFDHLEVSQDSSVEDQFAGNFTLESLFYNVFPKEEIPIEIDEAIKTILQIFSLEQVEIKDLLRGLHLWKLPTDTQVSLILFRLTKNGLDDNAREAVNMLIKSLDVDLNELETEDVDESYTPEALFDQALKNKYIPAEVQEAKGIIIHFLLSGSSLVKDVYRGICFANITSAKERLVAILKNVHLKRDVLGNKIIEALKVMSSFLHVNLGNQEIDPHTFNFGSVFDRAVPSLAPQSVQVAKNILLRAIKKRPGLFKKILDHITVEEYESDNEIANKILNATTGYKHYLSSRIRTALDLVMNFLSGIPIENKNKIIMDANEDSDEINVTSSPIGVRMFENELQSEKRKKPWKRKRRH